MADLPCAAIWDVDGTLVDTAELHYAAWQRLFGELERPFTRADFVATFGRRNPEIFTQILGDRLEGLDTIELADRKERYYRAAAAAGVALLPGVRQLLDGLAAAGFAQAIGSSAPRDNLDLILKLTGIRDLFGAIIGGEDATHGKPHPEVFLNAAAGLAVPPARCVVIEDAVVGVQAARAAGMRSIAVTFSAHSTPESLTAAGADLVVPTLEKIAPSDVRALLA